MKEIITLQLGNLSNYVASHFWNTQESYFTYSDQEKPLVDHNVHWRAGIGADGSDTFLPRTVVYDLKGGFGSMRKINALYDTVDEVKPGALWSGPSAVHKQPIVQPSAYQQSLDTGATPPQLTTSSVRYWSDFSRVYFHPKSLVQLYDFELNSSVMPFERFDMGTELFGALDKEHDIVDRDWRPFVEECDRMQGIQVFASVDDAWGGFAAQYLEALVDEYPKTPIWTWALQSPVLGSSREKRQMSLVNTAQSLAALCSQAAMVVPLSIPETGLPSDIRLNGASAWHVSALYATALESATLPSRLTSEAGPSSSSLGDMAEALNTTGDRTLANMQMTVQPSSWEQSDNSDSNRLDIYLSNIGRFQTPGKRRSAQVFGQISTLRGIDLSSDTTVDPSTKRIPVGEAAIRRYPTSLKFPLLDSYPSIYSRADGNESVDVHAALTTDSSTTGRMKALRTQVTRSVSMDEREALSNSLAEIGDAYREDWSSGSDEDDDDM